MKKKFSTSWKSSKQPRKKRKYLANAPLHIKRKFLSANLSKELRKKYGRRNFPLRKGDEVKILRGKFKKKIGKIDKVFLKRGRVTIEKIQKKKKDGTKVGVFFHASNLQIRELNLNDKKRLNSLNKIKNKEQQKIKKEKIEEKGEEKVKEKKNAYKKANNKKNLADKKKRN